MPTGGVGGDKADHVIKKSSPNHRWLAAYTVTRSGRRVADCWTHASVPSRDACPHPFVRGATRRGKAMRTVRQTTQLQRRASEPYRVASASIVSVVVEEEVKG